MLKEEAKRKIVRALFPSMEGSRRGKAVVIGSNSISSNGGDMGLQNDPNYTNHILTVARIFFCMKIIP